MKGVRGLDATHHGWIQVDEHLQSTSHPGVFAAGDCAHVVFHDDNGKGGRSSPPKAGVYAVRAGPVLVENLTRYLKSLKDKHESSSLELVPYQPQDDFMKLLVCGNGQALGLRFGLAFFGKWVMQMKDAIDQNFMQLFRDLPESLAHIEKGQYDTSQYDDSGDNDPLAGIELPSPSDAAQLLQRTDDDVDFRQGWLVLRTMTRDESYRQDVLGAIQKTKQETNLAVNA